MHATSLNKLLFPSQACGHQPDQELSGDGSTTCEHPALPTMLLRPPELNLQGEKKEVLKHAIT